MAMLAIWTGPLPRSLNGPLMALHYYPGDVIGSGTVGTGCFLELNGTGKLNDPNYTEQWLQEGDVVEMEIDGLGILSNTIVKEEDDFSILDRKKINRLALWYWILFA